MKKCKRLDAGFAPYHMLWLLLALAVLATGAWRWHRASTRIKQCESNLLNIYRALELYELHHGRLPVMAFYPDDPRHAPDSLLVVLDPYAVSGDLGYCPNAHARIQKHGLSYVWNTKMNGQRLNEPTPPVWLLSDIGTLSKTIKPPHFRRYLILYSDGSIVRSKNPPDDIRRISY